MLLHFAVYSTPYMVSGKIAIKTYFLQSVIRKTNLFLFVI